jgi:hypothetical protein
MHTPMNLIIDIDIDISHFYYRLGALGEFNSVIDRVCLCMAFVVMRTLLNGCSHE